VLVLSSMQQQPRLLITGGEGDIAKVVAARFAREGWQVCAPSRAQLDVCNSEGLAAYLQQHGPFDCVIANAALSIEKLLLRMSAEDFSRQLEVNYFATKRVVTQARQQALEAGIKDFSCILLGSWASLHPSAGQLGYATSKAALLDLNLQLAAAWGADGHRINVVWPGFLLTKLTARLEDKVLEQAKSKHLLQRFSSVECCADFLLFLTTSMPHTSAQLFNLDSRPHY